MSTEYIQMIEDLKKEYRTVWNQVYKLDKTYWDADVMEAWADKDEKMQEQEEKREKQIEELKRKINKQKEENKGIAKKFKEIDIQMGQMRPDKIDEKITKLKEERKRLEAEIKKYS